VERGTVWLQDCICEGANQSIAGLRVSNATVVLDRCILAGFGVAGGSAPITTNDGVYADHAQVFASDCQFAGSNAAFDFSSGGARFTATAATVQCARCLVLGGNGDSVCSYGPGPAVRTMNGCLVSFADCTLRGGSWAPCAYTGVAGLVHSGP